MSRKSKERRTIRSREITIIGEGLTELFYFKHLKEQKGYRYVCKPRFFTQQTLTDMDRTIKRVLDDGGIAVCIFDADVTRFHDSDRHKLQEMRRKYTGRDDVILCDSMPSIEFWFLLHFIATNRYFADSSSVVSLLRRYIPRYDKSREFLSDPKWVADMTQQGGLERAKERAGGRGPKGESYTNLPVLFNALQK